MLMFVLGHVLLLVMLMQLITITSTSLWAVLFTFEW